MTDTRPVYLAPADERTLKARLLAPVFPRYRTFIALESEPAELRGPYRNMVLSGDGRLLFVRNPKCACTAIMQMMHHQATGRFYPRTIHRALRGVLLARYHWPRVKAALEAGTPVLFSVTRHPERRIASAFRNFFVDATNLARHKHMEPMRAHGFDAARGAEWNLDALLDYVARGMALDPLRVDAHWRLQTLNLGIGRLPYALVGKVETLATDLPRAFEMAGHPGFPPPELMAQRFNATRGAGDGAITAAQRRKVEALYAEDYEAFGY